jgi:hypothetical protein
MTQDLANRYVKPTGLDMFFNRAVRLLARVGIRPAGAQLLAVRGRTSGIWRTTPVNVLTLDDLRYLVAPRGHAEWVRNMRAAGGGELRLGSAIEPISTTELADAQKPPVIRAYLRRWGWEVGRFFDGLAKDATEAQILDAAPGIPVFRID